MYLVYLECYYIPVMRWFLLVIVLLQTVWNPAIGQERKILGRVLSRETNKPIGNANIIILGTPSGTMSNAAGFFELSFDFSKYKVLLVSHIGLKTVEVPVPVEDKFMFFLDKDQVFLNEVFLERYPSSHSTIEDHIEESPSANADYFVVESGATFRGGMDNFYDYIGNVLVKRLSNKPTNQIQVLFSINADGKAFNVSVSDTSSVRLNEIISVFDEMPAWTPATQRQERVAQHFILPLAQGRAASQKRAAIYKFIAENVRYPLQARRMGLEGSVSVLFKVDNGTIVQLTILKDIGGSCGEEVKRALSSVPSELMRALDDPGGAYVLPVNFGLEQDFEDSYKPSFTSEILLSPIFVTAHGIRQESKFVPNGSFSRSEIRIGWEPGYVNLIDALKAPKLVERLTLIDQGLETIPPEIRQLKNLEALDIGKNHLKQLPVELTTLANLKELYLYDNAIEELPDGFSDLSNLVVLGLARNKLMTIPTELMLLPKLEALDLGDNELTSLPAEFGKLKKLRVLSLKGNSIRTFPPEFYKLTKLERIDLSGNPLDVGVIELIRHRFKATVIIF